MSAVAAIIISKDKILLAKRSSTLSEEPNKWENMGGSIDEGESPSEAILREAKEELGIELLLKGIALEYKDKEGNVNCTVYYSETNQTPRLMEKDACTEIKWFSKEEIKDLELAQYTKNDFTKLGWI